VSIEGGICGNFCKNKSDKMCSPVLGLVRAVLKPVSNGDTDQQLLQRCTIRCVDDRCDQWVDYLKQQKKMRTLFYLSIYFYVKPTGFRVNK
jgi:hypothetical protein